jgi:hypothetical protein
MCPVPNPREQMPPGRRGQHHWRTKQRRPGSDRPTRRDEPPERPDGLGIVCSGERYRPGRSVRPTPLIQGIGEQHDAGRRRQQRLRGRIGARHIPTEIPCAYLEIVAPDKVPATQIRRSWRERSGPFTSDQALHALEEAKRHDEKSQALEPAGKSTKKPHLAGRMEAYVLRFKGLTGFTHQRRLQMRGIHVSGS